MRASIPVAGVVAFGVLVFGVAGATPAAAAGGTDASP
jgi:hypothetical protein